MPEIPVYFDVTIQHAGVRPERLIVARSTASGSMEQTLSIEEAAHVASQVLGRAVQSAEVVHLATRKADMPLETTAEMLGPFLVWHSDEA